MFRSLRLPTTLLAVTLAVAAPARALQTAPEPATPADGAAIVADAPPVFTARGGGALVVRLVQARGALGACAPASGSVIEVRGVPDPVDVTLQRFAVPKGLSPGAWYWQVVRRSPCTAGPVRALEVDAGEATGPSAPDPGGSAAALSRAPIPARIGSTNHATLSLATAGLPNGVSRSRFTSLVRNAAMRWRLRLAYASRTRARLGDGRSDVGFATGLVSTGALATTHVQFSRMVRVRTRCRPGGCVSSRRPGPIRIEVDVALRADLAYQQGPAYPRRTQTDLQTVILHELGHAAGNRRHTPAGCHDTPMVASLARGEWWRSASDYSYRSCASAPAGAPRTSERVTVREITRFDGA